MGEVYRARDTSSEELVAVKMLRLQDSTRLERFEREASVLAGLRHPGIVRYVAHGVTPGGDPFLAMEWLDGEELGRYLSTTGLSAAESVALVQRVAEAIGAAHSVGVVHRDLKPSNLFLLDGDINRVKVLDFGIARQRRATAQVTQTGARIGTPRYMAPEQVRGERDLDARIDVFALGCVLFECLTGRVAFSGDDELAVLAKILLEEQPRAIAYCPGIPPQLDELVTRMLAKDPAERPRDGHAVAQELSNLGTIGPTERVPARRASAAISREEQRLLCVLLASERTSSPGVRADEATLNIQDRDNVAQAMRSVVAPFGARLERLADGSVVVTLSGSGAATDQAAQAARCALALRRTLPVLPMALATGRGVLSSSLPLGEVIDRAASLLRTAPAPDKGDMTTCPIHVDEVTAGLLSSSFDVTGRDGGLALRGERERQEENRTLLGRPVPFVGRDRDLAWLLGLFEECVSEPIARIALVRAPSGVGKSRLRSEFQERMKETCSPLETWVSWGDPMRAGSPFGMLAQAIRRAAGIAETEPMDVKQRKLQARIGRNLSAEKKTRVTQFMAELCGIPFPDEGESGLPLRAAREDATLMGQQVQRAWEDWLAAETATQPVVLILEDLHWGDSPSIKLVDDAMRALHDRPFMVLALARHEVHDLFPRLWAERGLHELRLGELSRKASEKLVKEALGSAIASSTVRSIVERASGNAFYIEELIRAVADGKENSLPETVLAMVQARLESMESDARRVLRAGSVFGQAFWRGGLMALLGTGHRTELVDEWLDELIDREVIMRASERKGTTGLARRDEAYVFRHSIVRDAAYAMLTPDDLRLGHRLAAEWLEQAGESEAIVLAEHFELGGEHGRAVEKYRRAAEQALEANDLTAAIARADRGIACGATTESLGMLRLLQAEAHAWSGQFAQAEERGVEALQLLLKGSVPWCNAVAEVALASGRLAHQERLVSLGNDLAALGRDGAQDARALVISCARVGAQLCFAGRYDLADSLLEVVLQKGAPIVGVDPCVAAFTHRALEIRTSCAGDLVASLDHAAKAAASYERIGDLRNAYLERGNLGYGLGQLGAYEKAEEVLRAVVSAADALGLASVTALAKQNLGLVLAFQGCLDEARRVEVEALEACMRSNDRRLEASARSSLALILCLAGLLGDAENEAVLAVDLSRKIPPSLALSLAVLARICLGKGDHERAHAVASEAMSLLERLGGLDEGESLVRLMLAETLLAMGDRAAACQVIMRARNRLLEASARITDPTLQASFLERVPDNARILALASEWLGN